MLGGWVRSVGRDSTFTTIKASAVWVSDVVAGCVGLYCICIIDIFMYEYIATQEGTLSWITDFFAKRI